MDSGSWSYSAGEGTCDCEAGQLLTAWASEHPDASLYDFIAPAWEAYEPGPEIRLAPDAFERVFKPDVREYPNTGQRIDTLTGIAALPKPEPEGGDE